MCTRGGVQTIEGLDRLVNLENLWLGKNKITRIQVRGGVFLLHLYGFSLLYDLNPPFLLCTYANVHESRDWTSLPTSENLASRYLLVALPASRRKCFFSSLTCARSQTG